MIKMKDLLCPGFFIYVRVERRGVKIVDLLTWTFFNGERPAGKASLVTAWERPGRY